MSTPDRDSTPASAADLQRSTAQQAAGSTAVAVPVIETALETDSTESDEEKASLEGEEQSRKAFDRYLRRLRRERAEPRDSIDANLVPERHANASLAVCHDLHLSSPETLYTHVLPVVPKLGQPIQSPSMPDVWGRMRPRKFTPAQSVRDSMLNSVRWLNESPSHEPSYYLHRSWGFGAIEEKAWKLPQHTFAIEPTITALDAGWLALEELWALLQRDSRPALWCSFQVHRHIASIFQALRKALGQHVVPDEIEDAEYRLRIFVNAYGELIGQRGTEPAGRTAARLVKDYQIRTGLTVLQLAKDCQLDPKTMRKVLKGERIRPDQLSRISYVTGISLDELG